jgi:hypothetical protein
MPFVETVTFRALLFGCLMVIGGFSESRAAEYKQCSVDNIASDKDWLFVRETQCGRIITGVQLRQNDVVYVDPMAQPRCWANENGKPLGVFWVQIKKQPNDEKPIGFVDSRFINSGCGLRRDGGGGGGVGYGGGGQG